MHSVRSRRRKPYKCPRQQQPEQAPDASGAHMPMKAATPAPNQAPNPEGSQMLQHAHKRARAEPTQAPESSTGGETLQEALAPRALRPVQNFTAIGTQTPPKASTPTARDISRDMASATAPLHVTATAHQTQTPQLAHLQQPISLSTPGLWPQPAFPACLMLFPQLNNPSAFTLCRQSSLYITPILLSFFSEADTNLQACHARACIVPCQLKAGSDYATADESQLICAPSRADLATPPMPIPQAARGDTYFGTPFPGPVPAAAQKLIDAAIQQSMPFQADTSAAMQVGTPATSLKAEI